jgi:hypothetical protein
MDESFESQPPQQQPFASESAVSQKRRVILLAGVGILALVGGVIYYNILTRPVDMPTLSNNAVLNPTITFTPTATPIPTIPPVLTYRAKDHISYMLPPEWKEETSDTQTQLGVVVEEGLNFSSPPLSGFSAISGVRISISRYPKAITEISSMQQITDKMKAIYPKIMDIKPTTFDSRLAMHFWGDDGQSYEQYIVLENNKFDFLWYIDAIYVGSESEIMQLKQKFQPQVNQIFQSIHFK